MRYMLSLSVQLLALSMLAGCASSLTGINGGDFACKAPDGVQCQSVAGNYANAVQRNLPAYKTKETDPSQQYAALHQSASVSFAHARQSSTMQPSDGGRSGRLERIDPPSVGGPMRSPPKILRIWSAPWEDADGSFHDQSYSYITVDPGRWLVENALYRIRDQYTPAVLADETAKHTVPTPEAVAKPADLPPVPQSPATSPRPLRVKPLPTEPAEMAPELPAPRQVIIRPLPRETGKTGG